MTEHITQSAAALPPRQRADDIRPDEARSPTGAREDWPEGLRAAVETIRSHPLPMAVLWGAEPVQICNDAFCELLDATRRAGEQSTAKDWANLCGLDPSAYHEILAGTAQVRRARPVRSGGEGRRFDVALGPIRGESGEIGGALATMVETTPRVQGRTARNGSDERLALAVEAGAGGVFEHAIPVGPELFVSDRWREILGFFPQDLPPWQRFAGWFAERVHPDDRRARDAAMQRFLNGETAEFDAEFRVRDRTGEWTWVREYAKASERSEAGGVRRLIGLVQDVTKRKLAELEARSRAQHDTLTGLPDRSLFRERLASELQGAVQAGRGLSLVLIDLDRFKAINQEFGHAVGDKVLKEVADRISSCMRSQETLARLGSDEFAVVMPGMIVSGDAEEFGRRVREAIAGPMVIDGHEITTSASFGIAVSPEHGDDVTALLRHADLALRGAQRTGPGEIRVFDLELMRAAERRRGQESALRRAIENGELVLHYQPQFDLATREVRAVEALVRWRRSETELLYPQRFMALAKETGLVRPLGEWVLGEATRQAAEWSAQGIRPRIAINISHAEAAGPELLEAFDRASSAAGIGGEQFEFEIRHTVLIDHDSPQIKAFLDGCRTRGIALVIDDFGIGYSSKGYLRDLTVDKVKIDTSFVAGIGDGDNDALLEVMADLGHQLGKRVVAEGVETEGQLSLLREVGCDDAQGDLLCPPKPAAAVLAHLMER